MKITDGSHFRENWHDVLSLWNRVVNWSHYNTSERALKQEIKSLLLYMWNEKDWIKKEYPSRANEIEKYINDSTYIKVVADLANTAKHRELDRKPRSNAKQTNYYDKIQLSKDKSRSMYYIELDTNKVVEVFKVLRGALDEYEDLHMHLRSSNK